MAKLIPLHGKHGEGKFAIVDDEDYEKVRLHRWYVRATIWGHHYMQTGIRGKSVQIHRFITNAELGTYVDHRSGDTYDNQKSNLRICTNQQNSWNCKGRNRTSVYKGVYNKKGRWRAMIKVDGKSMHIGAFGDETEAAKAYDEAALRYFGEFSRLNFPT